MVVDLLEQIIEDSKKPPVIRKGIISADKPKKKTVKFQNAASKKEKSRRLAGMEESADCSTRGRHKAHEIVMTLIDRTVTDEELKNMCRSILPGQYEDVATERSIAGVCGYPLCSNPHQDNFGSRSFVIRRNIVYDVSRRRNYCCNVCFEASMLVHEQISLTPHYVRENETEEELTVTIPHLASLTGKNGDVKDIGGMSDFDRDIQKLRKAKKKSANKSSSKKRRPAATDPSSSTQGVQMDGGSSDDGAPVQTAEEAAMAGLLQAAANEEAGVQVAVPHTSQTQTDVSVTALNAHSNKVKPSGTGKTKTHNKISSTASDETAIRVADGMLNDIDDGSTSGSTSVRSRDNNGKSANNDIALAKNKKHSKSSNTDESSCSVKINHNNETTTNGTNKRTDIEEKGSNNGNDMQTATNKSISANSTGNDSSSNNNQPRRKTGQREESREAPKDDSLTLMQRAVMEVEQHLLGWLTMDSYELVLGRRYLQGMLEACGVAHSYTQQLAAPELETVPIRKSEGRYQQLCQQLDSLEMQEEAEAAAVAKPRPAASQRSKKMLPDIAQLKQDVQNMTLKVAAFYGGRLEYADGSSEVKPEECQERQTVTSLPLLDHFEQKTWRRNIFMEKLLSSERSLLMELHLSVEEVRPLIVKLVSSLHLTARNLYLRPSQWKIVLLALLKLLSVRYPAIKANLSDSAVMNKEVAPLLAVHDLDPQYLDRLLTYLLEPKFIIQKLSLLHDNSAQPQQIPELPSSNSSSGQDKKYLEKLKETSGSAAASSTCPDSAKDDKALNSGNVISYSQVDQLD